MQVLDTDIWYTSILNNNANILTTWLLHTKQEKYFLPVKTEQNRWALNNKRISDVIYVTFDSAYFKTITVLWQDDQQILLNMEAHILECFLAD